MSKVKLEIIMPSGMALEREAEHIIVPGAEGDIGISAGHTPLITKVRPGVMSIFDSKEEKYAIHDGFITIDQDNVRIVTETFEHRNNIDKERAQSARERAEQRLKDTNNKDTNFRRAEFALKRAVARMDTLSKAE